MDPAADLAAILNHLDRDVYLQATGKTLCKLSGAEEPKTGAATGKEAPANRNAHPHGPEASRRLRRLNQVPVKIVDP
jgi:hypothetical protein